ncbi:MAG: type II toxin-antitoxin system RelE/ParE family toxin [Cytophagales bacterium]|jgi:mRNA interferase RelE/StbE|nr:type II toxin-antitoxin system RelE/ParE family toxin [Cytophagales bacterium]MCA6368540.1 type II toxin-antitoxin system RelE/ParE family toxin [Cytophagales bacterium]MCA6370486.1 type II toxin-antitoxin system RelE/ParE family toxin [Cytophagales bacterium]MCA6377305.1 type II toxin-antitoxin system RelE/ParE family toxin [Cytophagales bacterium]MCA6384357.1 type II toxin-antitoxin system RelE/ParE family toxin [Cytophagales bacterium]
MIVLVDKSFERDAKRLPKDVQVRVKASIEKLRNSSLQELNLTKMEGAKNAFRLRVGDYRIGLYLEGDSVVLSRVLNRKEMYRYFPKK